MKRRSSTSRRTSSSRRNLRPASQVRGKDAVSKARRGIAKGASKVHPQLNRELAGR